MLCLIDGLIPHASRATRWRVGYRRSPQEIEQERQVFRNQTFVAFFAPTRLGQVDRIFAANTSAPNGVADCIGWAFMNSWRCTPPIQELVLALGLYCDLAQDWATCVLEELDLSECHPIPVAPTQEHAHMLLSRVEFIRNELMPLARAEGLNDPGLGLTLRH